MTSPKENQSYGNLPPPPIFDLTMEQQFTLRRIEDLVKKADKDDVVTVFLALQKQNYCLSNTIRNLLKEWPTHPATTPEAQSKFGILFEIKDFPTT